MEVRDNDSIMCRNIKRLREADQRAGDEDIEDAALQFVRKISGYRQPSAVNEIVFNEAVKEIAESSRRMLDSLQYRTGKRASA
jgi:hypothetical protein